MPRNKKAPLARDAKRDIGKELLQAIREVKAGKYGAKYQVATNSWPHKVRPRPA